MPTSSASNFQKWRQRARLNFQIASILGTPTLDMWPAMRELLEFNSTVRPLNALPPPKDAPPSDDARVPNQLARHIPVRRETKSIELLSRCHLMASRLMA
jgi:hypothetical protein